MSNQSIPTTQAQATATDAPLNRRDYIIFIIFIAILGSFSSLVNDMYLPAIPRMMRQYHTTPSMTQLGISAAMLCASTQPAPSPLPQAAP